MVKYIAQAMNRILGIFGIKIVKATSDVFTMEKGLERISAHQFAINSVIDIGASNGSWSVKAMKHFPDSFFLALDPLSEREDDLKRLQQKHTNFSYELCVVGEQNSIVALNVSGDLDGSTVAESGNNLRKVPSKTLDTLVTEKKLAPPYLLKFDTHGYEIPIIRGAQETLKDTNIIIMEVYNFQITDTCLRFSQMCQYMEKIGFRVYDLADPMLRKHDRCFWQMDLFFCRKDSEIFSHNAYQ